MSERLSQVDLSAEVASQRAAIINGVLKDGLKSSAQLEKEGKSFFGSFDRSPREFISFRLLFPRYAYQTSADFDKNLEFALYLRGVSILPVIAERQTPRGDKAIQSAYEATYLEKPRIEEDVIKILEQRISSSFIVIMNETMGKLTRQLNRWIVPASDISYAMEEHGRPKDSKIPADRFSYLLFPEVIWGQYQDRNTAKNISQVKIVRRKVERNLFHGKIPLSVPDYESDILEILEERKEPIWIHGVRLPNEEDLFSPPPSQVAPSKL